MKPNALRDSWRYFKDCTGLDASSSSVMVVSIPFFVVMALYLRQCWEGQSHRMNYLTSTVTDSPLKSLTESLSDMHPDCSDSDIWQDFGADSESASQMYQPILVETHDTVNMSHNQSVHD